MSTLKQLINYRNQYPQLGLPRTIDEFESCGSVTYEQLVCSGFIDQLKTKSDTSVILRTGGTSSLAYKVLPSSRYRFTYNDRRVSQCLLYEVLRHQGLGFLYKLLFQKVVFLPGNMFEADPLPVRYVSNTLVAQRGWIGDLICPVPQAIFDGLGYDTSLDKLRAIALCYHGRSPCVISGIPAVVLQFATVWKDVYGSYPVPDIVIVGGCAVGPYVDLLRNVLGDTLTIIPYYNATEGTFGYQPSILWNTDDYETLQLALDCGVWYEFKDQDGRILSLADTHVDQQYTLIVSTYDGLCRYELGDVIEIVDMQKSRIKIVGRTSEYIDIANEHTQLSHIRQTIDYIMQKSDIVFVRYVLYPAYEEGRYYILVVEGDHHQTHTIAQLFDEGLQSYNHNYAAKRQGGTLGSVQVVMVEQGWFDDLIAQLNEERQSTQSKLLTLYPSDDNPVARKLKLYNASL